MAQKVTAEVFSARVDKLYNGKYTVIKESFINTKKKVKVRCNIHNIVFEIIAETLTCRSELSREHCPECLKEIRKELYKSKIIPFNEALKKFREKYGDKFSYDENSYSGVVSKIKIHCNDCGSDFELTAFEHLRYGNGGCPICRDQ